VDFFARQEAARRATRWLLVAFLASVVIVAAAVAALVFAVAGMKDAPGENATGPAVLAGVVTLLVIFGASLFKSLSLRAGGGVVARSLGGTRVERGTRDLALKRLHNVVEEMAIASGVTMPEVYVLEAEDGINAFAAGKSPADAAVAVTRGALTRLNREELQGVIAHEFSHVLNGDMRLNSKLLGWVFGLLVVAIAARLFLQGAAHGGRRRDKGGALVMVALAIMVIGYIGVFVGRILQAAVSRHRERLADASAVQFTRNPGGLVSALLKLAGVSSGSKLTSPEKEEVAHMLFAPGMARLFATHPSIGERVRELDPAMQRQNLDALAAAAAREAEQLRLAPSFSDVTPSATSHFAGPVDTEAADRVASLAGTFDETQMRYAREARRALPESLHAFGDSPDAARVLLFALLRGAEPNVASRQDEIIERSFGAPLLAQIHSALPMANELARELRLPAVQQLIPALRRMTVPEREELRSTAQQFALADDRIDVFECCLTLLLEAALRDDLEHNEEHGWRSLAQSTDAACTLFAVLAEQGTADAEAAGRAYQVGVESALPRHRPFAPVPRWPEALRDSLRELAMLRPLAKKGVIEGLVSTVAHDRRLAVAEGELLRTVCAVLHCPLPPILAAGTPGR
jgi:Zn-dependent protease with chaperone function